jgi:NAD(P)-dependent dehydrogenase (short-subunit alcohol dehydrogenase family)
MRALVTGGDQGLGLEISNQLEKKGYEVHILTNAGLKRRLSDNLGSMGTIKSLIPDYNFDVVINNWGVNRLSWIGKENQVMGFDPDMILSANVGIPYAVIAELVRRGNKPAKVINVSSITHRVAQRCTSIYCASKAALVQLTRVQSRELSPLGWQINCFAPGKILDTDMSNLTDAQVLELRGWAEIGANAYATSNVPMERFMDVHEAAYNCLTILEFSTYVNGAVIDCSGGQ